MTEALGCESLVIDAGESEACYRRRSYWMNFEAEKPDRVEVDPNSVLEPGRTTWWERLPTVVASGITSWSTREVVQDEWGQVGPLKIGEMEKAMGYDVGYTYAEGISLRERYRLIGNAFHVGVMRHLLCCYMWLSRIKWGF